VTDDEERRFALRTKNPSIARDKDAMDGAPGKQILRLTTPASKRTLAGDPGAAKDDKG
jgi:hypothetical protein